MNTIEEKAKAFLINKGYPIDANGVFPTYEEMYNIISKGLENQADLKTSGIWFNTKDTTASSERDIVGWYKTDGKLDPSPKIVWFCSEEEARKEAEENNDCFLAYWAELPEQDFEKNYWFKEQGEKPQGKTALEAINEEKIDNANKNVVDFKAEDWHVSKVDGKIHNIYYSDKDEPKFKVGDWVVTDKGDTIQIAAVNIGYYTVNNGMDFNMLYVDKYWRLWTIEDAKEGDVLVCPNDAGDRTVVFIFKQFVDNMTGIDCFCCIDSMGIFDPCLNIGYVGDISCDDYYPAAKEQRELLFQKMRDAGYEWDDVNKELKKIDEEFNGEDYGIDSLFHARTILEKTLGSVEGYQSDDGMLEHKCAISAVKKLYRQKPAKWTEEDELNLKGIIDEVEANKNSAPSYDLPTYDKFLNWLKSLKKKIKNE